MSQQKINVNDTEYTLQKIKPREWLRLKERCKNKHGQPNEEKMYEEVLEHIVVSPKKKLDDFEDMADLEGVVAAAIRFQLGRTAEE